MYARNLRDERGRNVYTADWDVLVILDSCRHNPLVAATDGYDLLTDPGRFKSLASMTKHWMERTFVPEYADATAETVYICGNPYSDSVLNDGDFAELDEVWRSA